MKYFLLSLALILSLCAPLGAADFGVTPTTKQEQTSTVKPSTATNHQKHKKTLHRKTKMKFKPASHTQLHAGKNKGVAIFFWVLFFGIPIGFIIGGIIGALLWAWILGAVLLLYALILLFFYVVIGNFFRGIKKVVPKTDETPKGKATSYVRHTALHKGKSGSWIGWLILVFLPLILIIVGVSTGISVIWIIGLGLALAVLMTLFYIFAIILQLL